METLSLAPEALSDELLAQIKEQFAKYGFVKFVGHGIEEELIAEAFTWSKRFFTLPDDIKETANRPAGPGPNRGYAAVGVEKLAGISGYSKGVKDPKLVEDIKESFDLGPAHDSRHPTPWPAEEAIPDFRAFMQTFSYRCDQVHMRILGIVETALGLPDGKLTSLCDSQHGELRIAHYPPVKASRLRSGTNAFRIAEHSDTGTLTLLFQDSVGGLEIESPERAGEFMPVAAASPLEMIVNIGDTLQRWTAGTLRSTIHRVVAPREEAVDASSSSSSSTPFLDGGVLAARYSIGFFGKANPQALMRTLDGFVAADERLTADAYDYTTAAEYYAALQTKTFPKEQTVGN